MEISFHTHKEYTEISGHSGKAAITMSDVAIACRYLSVFLWCGAVPVMEFRENIASLAEMRYHDAVMSHVNVTCSTTMSMSMYNVTFYMSNDFSFIPPKR